MADLGSFCVEWLHQGAGLCVLCENETGTWHKVDPVGPVCDRCMIDRERGLGALMMTANILRELAEEPTEDRAAYDRVMVGMTTYASRYSKSEDWPIRRFNFLQLLDQLTQPTN